MVFIWEAWNLDHIAKHGVSREEAQYVVAHAARPFPREVGDAKQLIWGPTSRGRLLQVVFAYRGEDEIDYGSLSFEDLIELTEVTRVIAVYVIHAMPLTERMVRQYRKLQRK
jgi:uncharacterized DUF497 family protein